MIGWLIFTVYLAGFLMTWRRAAWVLATDFAGHWGPLEGEDLLCGVLFGGFTALAWPIVAPGYIAYHTRLRGDGATLLERFMRAPRPKRHAVRIEELEREAKDRERRIAQLERELEIGVRQ